MSAASTSTAQARPIFISKNVLWLETLMVGMDCDFGTMQPGEFVKTEPGYPVYSQAAKFYARMGRYSPTKIFFSLFRVLENPAVKPDPGYHLEISFHLLRSQLPAEIKRMNFEQNEAGVLYDMDLINSEEPRTWKVRCVIKMVEFTSQREEDRKRQNGKLKATLKRWDPEGVRTEKLAFILERQNLDELFTGLQDDDFANTKIGLLERTFCVVDEVYEKWQMQKENKPYQIKGPLEKYLDYIFHGHVDDISKENCIKLFIWAHRYGLEFLRVLCMEFFEKHFEDNDYLIDILKCAILTNEGDEHFMNIVLALFFLRINTIMVSEKWQRVSLTETSYSYSILDMVFRRSAGLGPMQEPLATSAQLPETTE